MNSKGYFGTKLMSQFLTCGAAIYAEKRKDNPEIMPKIKVLSDSIWFDRLVFHRKCIPFL